MGFDLWNILGVSPQTGLVAAVGTLVLAGLMGIRLFLRNQSAHARRGACRWTISRLTPGRRPANRPGTRSGTMMLRVAPRSCSSSSP